jgi:hypothetical protein
MATRTGGDFLGDTMDRQIVYPGAIPLETDLLNTNKFAMIGLAKLASAILGTDTCMQGLSCKPAIMPPMDIVIGEGQIYSLQNADGTPYSSLAENKMAVLKQGLKVSLETFSLTAPSTPGHSINYLLKAAYGDVDSGPVVLPYYNAANPAVAYSGPNNAGNAQATVRSGVCVVSKKNGISAATGSQLTPIPDAGHVAAWVITVPYGAKSIDTTFITQASSAPFLPADGLVSAIQQGKLTQGMDAGSVNNFKVQFNPAIKSLTDGMRVCFRAKTSNTASSTLLIDNLSPYPVVTSTLNELQKDDVMKGQLIEVVWNSEATSWVLNQESYTRAESDKEFLSKKGGEIDGILEISKGLQVGECKLLPDGNIEGKCWGRDNLKDKNLLTWLGSQTQISGNEHA